MADSVDVFTFPVFEKLVWFRCAWIAELEVF